VLSISFESISNQSPSITATTVQGNKINTTLTLGNTATSARLKRGFKTDLKVML
jgi:hypothetical protein